MRHIRSYILRNGKEMYECLCVEKRGGGGVGGSRRRDGETC